MPQPFVENVSRDAIVMGIHSKFDYENDLLIQITDPDSSWPTPHHKFKNVKQYKFWDSEGEDGPTRGDAVALARDILVAFHHSRNILVHCQAGLCRSGAVAEAAILLGFKEVHTRRWPNRQLGDMLSELLAIPRMAERDYEELFKLSEY